MAAAASIASLLPFVVGLVLLALAPASSVYRLVHAEQEQALRLAAASLAERRGDLRERAAELPDQRVRELFRRRDADALRAWFGDRDVQVQFREGVISRPEDGPVAAWLQVRERPRPGGIAIFERLQAARLGQAGQGGDFELAWVQGTQVRASTRPAWNDSLRVRREADGRTSVTSDELVVRTRPLDTDETSQLVAMTDGTRAELLFSTRGDEMVLGLALLLAVGLCCSAAAALVVDRVLRRVAERAERLAAGDFSSRLPVVGRDAGAAVARSLNHLSSELQQRIDHLQAAFDQRDRTLAAIEDGVCLWDADGCLQLWNRAAEEMTGVDARDAAGAASAPVEFLRANRRPGRRRVLLPKADGSSQLAVDLVTTRTSDGGTLQVLHDATRAVSLEQVRRNFLVTAAHELRTPLASVLGFSATLSEHWHEIDADARQAVLDRMEEEAQRLSELVDRFFESSLLADDRVNVSAEPVALRGLTLRALEQVSEVHELSVIVDVPEELTAFADPDALHRVLVCLVDNAGKYGAAPIHIRAEAADEGHIALAVEDSGPGIPRADRESVFEPFFRLDPEMRLTAGGSGLGLFVARRLVEAMGGSIRIEDRDGGPGGARVCLRLRGQAPETGYAEGPVAAATR